jgi:hypothetical protein
MLARPATALAADDDDDVLMRLIRLEDSAAQAQRGAPVQMVSALADDEADHVKALQTHLGALGDRSPRRATGVAPLASLDAGIALEASLVAAYRQALVELQEPAILQTAATILASHAQHRALLLGAAGRDPFGQ